MILPNAIVAGAPRCGTTFVYNLLARHPDVCGPKSKETFFLMDRGSWIFQSNKLNYRDNFNQKGLTGYSRYFSHCDRHAQIIIEGSTPYIYQQTALKVLSQLETNPIVIFILRKPSERIYSTFRYFQNNKAFLQFDITFSQFIDMVKNGDARIRDNEFLAQVIQHSQYIDYLVKWRQAMPDRTQVYLHEDIATNPSRHIKQIAENIGLDASFYDDIHNVQTNASYSVRNRTLHVLTRPAAEVLSAYLADDGYVRAHLRKLYRRFNVQAKKSIRTTEDRALCQQLDSYFEPYNRRLAIEFKLRLESWC